MMTPDDIDVWVGLDVGKSAHHFLLNKNTPRARPRP